MNFKEKKAAPDFVLKDLEENPIRLDAFKGKVVLLYFWTMFSLQLDSRWLQIHIIT